MKLEKVRLYIHIDGNSNRYMYYLNMNGIPEESLWAGKLKSDIELD